MIRFNEPPHVGGEEDFIADAVREKTIASGGKYYRLCNDLLERTTLAPNVRLTVSCTAALEAAAILCGVKPGDEVIMPSFTFVSTANAFVLRGAKIVFVDIRPDTMNIDENKIGAAITDKTRVIVPVHYAGVACEMDAINRIAKERGIYVVEDAAQALYSRYDGRYLGTLGDIGCCSFHETKNFSMGEGGALFVNDAPLDDRTDIICNKGTNRSDFAKGIVDKYSWVDVGSSFLPSDINAAYLYPQLLKKDEIIQKRLGVWQKYDAAMKELEKEGCIETMRVPPRCEHNAHIYYIKTDSTRRRDELIKYLEGRGIVASFHYVPLHSAPAGRLFGTFSGEDEFTTRESGRLLRLPLHYALSDADADAVIGAVRDFYRS